MNEASVKGPSIRQSPENRTAIVTRSSRGMQRQAKALRLSQDGYDVCVNNVRANNAGAEEFLSKINRSLQAFNVEKMVGTSVSELDPLNTIVAYAGIAQDLHRMFEVNGYGVYNCYVTVAKQTIKKWAVRGMSQSFAMEIAMHKITDLINKELGKVDELIALGRRSVPKNVSKVVGFISGPESEYVTGQTMVDDGGIVFTY
ncbi:NAD(P)-binding protein [Lepidopterella palustris CBS 459.81]|uniref:NAD(P)-binding protein n=1 Tax=Lepidopterella palustris CBS 459.81 TaxID=1314670 RepID=A0A8E2EE59_9PEZI|nr:NAD(P)-binding protein [Lepidopterella palustris CBS 459.81]